MCRRRAVRGLGEDWASEREAGFAGGYELGGDDGVSWRRIGQDW